MAFASNILGQTVMGNKTVMWGEWTNGGGDTGGDIATGLRHVDFLTMELYAAAVVANNPVVNETHTDTVLPASPTIVTNAGDDGRWLAIGEY